MKIFLDTADVSAISSGWSTGLIDGITTNPTLIRKSGRNHEDVYQEIKDIGILNDITCCYVPNNNFYWYDCQLSTE